MTVALGHPADKPLSLWNEMFLPVRMAVALRSVAIPDSTGARIPLVRSEAALFTSGRAPEPSAPPNYFPWYVAIGILLAGALIGLVRSAEGGNRFALFAATVIATLWSLVAGLCGAALVFAWAFTKHYFMGRNENLMHFDPLHRAGRAHPSCDLRTARRLEGDKAERMGGSDLSVRLRGTGIPLFDQKNGEIIALALPMNLAVWWTVYRLTSYRRTSFSSSAAL